MMEESALQHRMQRIGDLIGQLSSEETARSRELLESVMSLHGEALERILQRLRDAGQPGEEAILSLGVDPVVSSVLLLYGLHPLDLETRVNRAIDRVRPSLRAYGVFAELIGAGAGHVRIRLRGVDSSFTARTVRSSLEEEMYAAAPDAASFTILGLEKFAAPDFVPLETLCAAEKA